MLSISITMLITYFYELVIKREKINSEIIKGFAIFSLCLISGIIGYTKSIISNDFGTLAVLVIADILFSGYIYYNKKYCK